MLAGVNYFSSNSPSIQPGTLIALLIESVLDGLFFAAAAPGVSSPWVYTAPTLGTKQSGATFVVNGDHSGNSMEITIPRQIDALVNMGIVFTLPGLAYDNEATNTAYTYELDGTTNGTAAGTPSLLGAPADESGAREIAQRARGTPRIAGRLLRRVVDFAVVDGDGKVTKALADHALTRLGVDNLGLDSADRRYLKSIAEHYAGGPVGVETLSAALSESRDALEDVIEPYLLQQGLVQRTPRGRMLGQRGWNHLGLRAPKSETDLFN